MAWDRLTSEQRELRDGVRQLARTQIAPRAAEIDASHEFPWDVVEPALIAAHEQGLRELYVALTRPTKTLVVVHARPLPDGLGVPAT